MPNYNFLRRGRNWNLPTVGRGRDTRDLVPRGHHGNRGSLTFSIPRKLAESFLAKFGNGQAHMHLKLERRGHNHDQLALLPAKANEFGRKFSIGSKEAFDYRVFFDASAYPWIGEIEPFASTETTAELTNEGVIVQMPAKDKRITLVATEYRARKSPSLHWKRQTMPDTVAPEPAPEPEQSQDTLYLVNVPPEKDAKFQTAMRFLKLEFLKE